MPTWAIWLVALGLLLLRALLAAAESALYSTSERRIKELSGMHPIAARRVLRQRTEREATIAAVRIGMVLAGFMSAALGTLAMPDDWGWSLVLRALTSAVITGILASVLDVAARAITSQRPNRWALRLSAFIMVVATALYPLMRVMVAGMNLLLKPFGRRVHFE